MADDPDPLSLLAALMSLTVVSGLVDAVSYLGLGHVFTANMTGNVVVLGFAAAGAAGFSVPATLTSLLVFLAGAAIGALLFLRVDAALPLLASAALTAGTGAAYAFSARTAAPA